MQPTFLPWLGYFALIDAVDHFVFLDDVQLSRQSWQSRNRIKGPQGEIMLSLGLARKPSKPLIYEAKLADTGFQSKLLNTVEMCLGKAPYYSDIADILNTAFNRADGRLAPLNISVISDVCRAVGIETPLYRSSDMKTAITGSRSSRLLELCRYFDAETYLSPPGSAEYLAEEGEFNGPAPELRFLNYVHPEYQQLYGDFLPYMACIDALGNVGFDNALPLIRSGIGQPFTAAELAQKEA